MLLQLLQPACIVLVDWIFTLSLVQWMHRVKTALAVVLWLQTL